MKEQNTKWPSGPTSSSVRKSWLSISTVIAFAVATIWFFRPYLFPYAPPQPSFFTTHNDIRAPLENIWAELSDDEFKALTAFLYDESNGLNLTPTTNASTGNTIHRIEALRPNKTEVLSYTRGLAESSPSKWAHVIIDQGVWPNTSLNEYMVGPLPVDKQTEIIPLTYLHNSGRSSTRNVAPPREMVSAWAREVYLEVGDIVQDLLGEDITLGNETNIKDVELQGQTPHLEGDRLISWCSFMSPGVISESPSLLIQGLYMRIDTTESDSSAWQITRWMYNGIVYESTEEFRAAIKRADFERTPFNLDGPWTTLEDFGPGTKGRELPPPVMVQTTPPRYGVDRKQDYVSWMGFTFYIAFSQVTGITLYDIKFDGEPIIYELGLQEALAHYAGDDPMQGNRVFLDTFYNMGELMFELVPGYDCPAYASFLDTKFYKNGEKVVNKNSICLFEFTADYALQRHSASNYVSVSRNTFFVVRTVSTVGNYDYTIEYIFYLDGVIEVKIRASGFIFSSYWSPQSSPDYGFRVHDQVATGIHTHVLNFKADVDIGGTLNTMTRVGIEGTSIDYPYDSLPPRHTMHLTWETVTEETGLNWPANTAETFFIGNNDSVNAWGQKRGYLVRSGTGMGNPVHLVVKNSTAIGKAVEWANMDLWVAKQKDTEAKSASPYNVLDIHDPIIDFSKFIDGENIEQEDLVIYFNLGGHHVPHSGDIPNTLMHTSASSVMFLPYNFHDRDPSRHSSTGVRVDLKDRNKTQYYGGRIKEGLSVKLDEIEPDMTEYKAKDHPVRKFFGIHG